MFIVCSYNLFPYTLQVKEGAGSEDEEGLEPGQDVDSGLGGGC